MSIIHDALKKVQQGLLPKTDGSQVSPSTTAQNPSAYLYVTPPETGTLTPTGQQTADQKPLIQNKINSVFTLCCAMAITVTSVVYINQRFQNNIPNVQIFSQGLFYKLTHHKGLPDFKSKAPQDLKPLAQITVMAPKPLIPPSPAAPPDPTKTPAPTNTPAISNTVKPNVPEMLNIHGVMSNGSNNLVLINNRVYQEGDDVDGMKITKISLDYITIMNNGKEEKISVEN